MLSVLPQSQNVVKICKLSLLIVQSLDANAFGDDAVLGCDFVGTVEMTGDKVSRVKAGTVIAGLIWGGQLPSWTFLFYSALKLSFEQVRSRDWVATASTPSQMSAFASLCPKASLSSRPQQYPLPRAQHCSLSSPRTVSTSLRDLDRLC